jgi:Ras-related GTP-binding protein A/B
MENYFASQRHTIFRNVAVLIYVFDVESRELEKDFHYFQSCLSSIAEVSLSQTSCRLLCNCVLVVWGVQNSKDAKIFCLIHKMDLIQESQRAIVFAEREAELKRRSIPLDITCFGTSIWDESLYKVSACVCIRVRYYKIISFYLFFFFAMEQAWSSIVVSLIPNVSALQTHLDNFARIMDADEVCVCVCGVCLFLWRFCFCF